MNTAIHLFIGRLRAKTTTSRSWKPQKIGIAILCLIILIYVYYFASHCFAMYDRHNMLGFDLAIFDQAVWHISRGETPFSTVRGMHVLGDHFSAILYLIAPAYWIAPTPKTLLLLQTVALASGAAPVYFYSLLKTKSQLASLLFSFSYLMYPALQWSNHVEFFPDNLATPFILAAFYFLSAKKFRSYLICVAIIMLTKEIAGLIVIPLGIYCLWVDKRIAAVTLSFGFLGMLAAILCMIYFNHGHSSAYFSLFSTIVNPTHLKTSFALLNPTLEPENHQLEILYLVQLFWPLAFLPLFAPEILMCSIPIFLINLLSSRTSMHSISDHYTAYLSPVMFVSGVCGYSRLLKLNNKTTEFIILCTLLIATIDGMRWSPLQLKTREITTKVTITSQIELSAILKRIPENASLSAQANLVVYLAHRKGIYTFPNPMYTAGWGGEVRALDNFYGNNYVEFNSDDFNDRLNKSDIQYILLTNSVDPFPLNQNFRAKCVHAVISSKEFGIIQINNSALLLLRGANHEAGVHIMEGFTHVKRSENEPILELIKTWYRMLPDK